MKFINKLLNIINIITINIFILFSFLSGEFFETTITIFEKVAFVLLGIINLVVGIKNIKNNNKKIGIHSIIISVILMFILVIVILLYKITLKDVFGYFNAGFKLLTIVLSIINLYANKKVEDNIRIKYITVSIWALFIIEIILGLIVTVFGNINKANIKKALIALNEDKNKESIAYEWQDNNNKLKCSFYDSNGQLIDDTDYELLYKSTFQSDTQDEINVLTVLENNKTWIVNSEGKKIIRLYSLFENVRNKMDFTSACAKSIVNNGYHLESTRDFSYVLPLQNANDNNLLFGNLSTNEYQLNVILKSNELEKDTKLPNIYDRLLDKGYLYNQEQINKLKKIYKYKKEYYLITKNGERKKIDCNNIFFIFDNQGNLGVWLYSNLSIPFFDTNSNGYINANGEKFSSPNSCIVYDVMNNYKILYEYKKHIYYILSNDNKLLIEEQPEFIEFHNDKYLITDQFAYVIQKNGFLKISNNKHVTKTNRVFTRGVDFINIKDSNNLSLPSDIKLPFDRFSLYLYD